jgi:hypothetical protein
VVHSKLLVAGCFASAFIFSSSAMAQKLAPNAEECVGMTWGYLKSQGYEYGAVNTCPYPVAIWFKTHRGKMRQDTVQSGQGFRTGLTIDKFESERRKTGWIAAICRVGEAPNLSLSDDTWDAILESKYECRKP